MLRPRPTAAERATIQRAWRRIEPLALYPRPLDTERVRILKAPWLFAVPWFRRFDGYTVWSTILLRKPELQADDDLIAHELVHVWQGQHEWPNLWISYIRPSTFWGDRSGYWQNRYELQARAAVAKTASPADPSTPVIRPCRNDEIPAVLSMWATSRSPAASTKDTRQALQRLREQHADALLVAELDGRIVGTVIAASDGWRGNIYRLVVDPAHRRRGIARRLVAAAEARLLERGVARVSALVDARDDVAMGLWDSLGYQHHAALARFVRNF